MARDDAEPPAPVDEPPLPQPAVEDDASKPTATHPAPRDEPRRHSERHTAITTAVIALVAAILGGAVTAGASVWIANFTVRSQEKQSIEEYRRDNREGIYADILAQFSAMDGVMERVSIRRIFDGLGAARANPPEAPPPPPPDPLPDLRAIYEQWQTEYDKLTAAISSAELVSSHRVIDICRALQDAYYSTFHTTFADELMAAYSLPEDLQNRMRDLIGNDPLPPAYDPALKGRPISELRAMFITEAKDDLATND